MSKSSKTEGRPTDTAPTLKNTKRRKRRGDSKRNSNNSKSYVKNEGMMTSLKDTPDIVTSNNSYDNDPKWYMNLDSIAKSYASLPMSNILGLDAGSPYRKGLPNSNWVENANTHTAAGFMTIHFEPTIGPNDSGSTAAVNLAAQQLYTIDRRANSGAKNYDRTDVMMVFLAMDSAYMLYEDMLRAYRVLSTFNANNRYYPTNILNALGYDTSLQYHIAEFRGILDTFAYKLASVNLPDQMDIIKRHSWMCSNIYLDDDNNKGQSYAFVPQCLYKWTEAAEQPTYLSKVTMHDIKNNTPWDLNVIASQIDALMNPILGSEDLGVITGDLAKAFGDSGMIKIRPVEDYAALVPVYSAEVSMQIRNIFSLVDVTVSSPGSTGNIEPVVSDLVKGPYLSQKFTVSPATDGARRINTKPVLNFVNEDPSPENVLVATRLMSLSEPAGSGGLSNVSIYGTENVVGTRVWMLQPNLKSFVSYSMDQDIYFGPNMPANIIYPNVERLVWTSQFNNAPAIYMYTSIVPSGTSDASTMYAGVMTNLNNYLFMDDDTLKHLHEVATMSLFTVKDYKLSF